jgi:TRAP-type C4-dicarboxylate transport system permease small subunit
MKNIESVAENLAGIACFLLMVAVCWGVFERYVFKMSLINGLYNMIESYIFPVLVFAAVAGSYRAGLWPRLEVLVDRMPAGRIRVINTINEIIGLVMYVSVTYFTCAYAIAMTIEGRQFQAGATTYLLWPLLWLVPIAFALLSIEVLLNLGKLVFKEQVTKISLD